MSRYSIVCICQVYNEMRKGNLVRFVKHVKPLVDALIVYDDGSTDGSYEYLLSQTPYVIRGSHNDFANETSHKQILLHEALKLVPDFILWLDADEVLTANAADCLQSLCAMCIDNNMDALVFHEINLWRSHSWRRLDSLFDTGWFVRLWKVSPGMCYPETRPGLHQRSYPSGIERLGWVDIVKVLHYGFSSQQRLAHKYLVYQSHGQRGYDMLDRLISEEQLVLEKVPRELFPEDLWVDDDKPVPLTWQESLAYVENYRDEVFKPQFSIICLIYNSVDWLKFVYQQLYRYTNMNDKEFFFVANNASDEVLSYLQHKAIPHYVFNTPDQQEAGEENNVYQAYNFAASQARGEVLIFISSDMAFSSGWFDKLWAAYNGTNCVSPRLVESGKLLSGQYGIARNFGQKYDTFQEINFQQFAYAISKPRVENGGLFMPLLVRKEHFEQVGGYPEGSVQVESNLFQPVLAQAGEQCIPAKIALIMKLMTRGIVHQTAFNSIVYHFQRGEKES